MRLPNLAGKDVERNDKQIRLELLRCGIHEATWDCGNSEVRTNVAGISGSSRFFRAWTYWTVNCQVPVEMAKRIYAHPVGHSDIRVGGHAGCIAPERPYVEWRDPATGKKYATANEREEIEKFKDKYPDMYTKFLDEHLFHDDPASVGAIGTVDSYHIDTELGLYVFVQFLRGHL